MRSFFRGRIFVDACPWLFRFLIDRIKLILILATTIEGVRLMSTALLRMLVIGFILFAFLVMLIVGLTRRKADEVKEQHVLLHRVEIAREYVWPAT